jgi:hypothetical protein
MMGAGGWMTTLLVALSTLWITGGSCTITGWGTGTNTGGSGTRIIRGVWVAGTMVDVAVVVTVGVALDVATAVAVVVMVEVAVEGDATKVDVLVTVADGVTVLVAVGTGVGVHPIGFGGKQAAAGSSVVTTNRVTIGRISSFFNS